MVILPLLRRKRAKEKGKGTWSKGKRRRRRRRKRKEKEKTVRSPTPHLPPQTCGWLPQFLSKQGLY